MRFICYSASNLPLLYLSPYVKVTLNGGEASFYQLMFRMAIKLEGKPDVLSECLRLLRSGIASDELIKWGKERFSEFPKWIERALRAGIIE